MKDGKSRVLFLLPYPLHRAASQRFRVENLLPLLDEAGIPYTLRPFMSEATWNILYTSGSIPQKALGILKGYFQRCKTVLLEARSYDWIFIHRGASSLGPPVFEWYIAKVLRKKIIYDFDDAIWIPNTSAENKLASGLKAFWKVGKICKWANTVTAGNDFLCQYARAQGATNVVKLPTVVDTEHRYNILKQHGNGKVIVGWTGSFSTLKYLDDLMPMLQELQQTLDFTFLVIADKVPDLPLRDWVFIPWNALTEIEDLLKIDIGLMPLTPDAWSAGKCGFKLIQYMALGIPAVASPVGVNTVIVRHGENGYLAGNPEEWKASLTRLIKDKALRQAMGRSGRTEIVADYSINSQKEKFLQLFG